MANGRPWTQDDQNTLERMSAVGYTDGEIANVTGHERKTVTRHRNAAQIDPCTRVDWWMRKRRWDTIAA